MNKKILMILLGVVMFVLVAVGGILFFVLRDTSDRPVVYYEYRLEEQYSNLADTERRHIVKYRITIEYTDPDILPQLETNRTKFNNYIDEIMLSTTSEDLLRPNGKQRLRERILMMIIDELDTDEETITNIYITPFVVQG